jgi:hypothetical protein
LIEFEERYGLAFDPVLLANPVDQDVSVRAIFKVGCGKTDKVSTPFIIFEFSGKIQFSFD